MAKFCNLVEVIQSLKNEEEKGVTFISRNTPDAYVPYKDIYHKALKVLYNFQNMGLLNGCECIFQINDNEQFVYIFWACVLGGIIPIPVAVGINDEHRLKLFRIWENCTSPYLITDINIKNKLEKFGHEHEYHTQINRIMEKSIITEDLFRMDKSGEIYNPSPNEIVFIQFSSGSTGNPKGVVLSHENLLNNIYAMLKAVHGTSSDSSLSWMPLTHDMGLIGFHITPIVQNYKQYIISTQSFIMSPGLWLEKASEYHVTILSSTNFGLSHFLNSFRNKNIVKLDLSSVKILSLGAELISSSLIDKFLEHTTQFNFFNSALYPVYGLAEATLAVTFPEPGTEIQKVHVDRNFLNIGSKIHVLNALSDKAITFIGVGSPVPDCLLRICDDENNVLAENIAGHIQIKGKNVTKSYYNNKVETEKAFTADGWFKTGDVGFFYNSKLIITGRVKDIIILNGQNYYLNDIERIIEELPRIQKGTIASICLFDEESKNEELILFVIYKTKDMNKFIYLIVEIQKYLYSKIGLKFKFIIPTNKIPYTTSGKLMRYKLKEWYYSGEYTNILAKLTSMIDFQKESSNVMLEISAIEMQILLILKRIFIVESVDPDDNFFELGGDSFKAGMFISTLNKDFHVKVKLDDLFHYPSIRELASYIENLQKSFYEEIPKAESKQYYCLSSAQKRMFVLHQLQEKATAYNLLVAFKISGSPDRRKIEEVFNKIIKRHESLRTCFHYIDGKPMQHIQNKIDFKLEDINIAGEYTLEKLYEYIKKIKRPFDFNSEKPLFRVGVEPILNDNFLLILCVHHIIADGTSLFLLLKEFAYYYRNLNLPQPLVQYKDYSEWFQTVMQNTQRVIECEKYWIDEFKDGIPVLNLPTDYPRPLKRDLKGSTVHFTLDTELFSNIKNIVKNQKATLFIVLLTCYYVLLYKYTSQEDIIVGTPVAGRLHPDLHDVIGLFINTLCLRNRPSGQKSFTYFLDEVKETVLKAMNNQEYQFENLLEKLRIQRNLNRNPVFDTFFVLHKMGSDIFDATGLQAERFPFENDTSIFDITFHVFDKKNEVDLIIDYSTQLFKKNTIERLIQHYIRILTIIVDNPDILINRIDINCDNDKQKILYEFNSMKIKVPKIMIQSLFEEQVSKTPDNIAVVCRDQEITYSELNDKANRIAALLRELGVTRNIVVGLMVSRSLELIIGILAIIKAGGIYLPIELTTPVDRINFFLKDSGTTILLAQREIWEIDKYEKISIKDIIYIDDPILYETKNDNPPLANLQDDPIYVIYTSGTTGNPKGVVIKHKNVLHLLYGLIDLVFNYFDGKLNMCLVASITFDVSVHQIFPSLLLGHTLYIMPDTIKKDSEKIVDFYIKNNIDISDATPTFLQFLLKGLKQKNIFFPIRYLIVVGEILPKKTIIDLLEYMKPESCKIANAYGPTECCVLSTFYEIDPTTLAHYNSIPIGKPMPNEKIYILDHNNNITPVGIPGELYISGEGVGKGYIAHDELTNERFLPDPFNKHKRMYKTGDLASWLPDGNIEFHGRIDNQVKIRGYRIEPEEIEIAIRKHPGINDVVVVAKEFFPGEQRLVAYILTNFIIYWDDMVDFLERKARTTQTCRRSEFRVKYQSPCILTKNDGTSYKTNTIDISYHGIALSQRNINIVEDEEVILSIILPDSININVKAINTYQTGKTLSLSFLTTDTEDEDIIKKAVDKIAKGLNLIVFDFRRSEYRIPINGKCIVKSSDGNAVEVSVRDLSHSGISLLALPENLSFQGELELSLTLEKSMKPIIIRGNIVWQTEKEIGIKFNDTRNYLIHMEFENHIKHRKLTVRELHEFLEKRLPDYMIPSIFIIIDSIPFTKSGKIDLNALPEPHLGKIKGTMYEPPGSLIEIKLIKIWQDILGINKIGINDNFFEIGGDSFKALQVVVALQSEYNISINDLISCQTISQLVRKITPKTKKTKEFLQTLYEEYEKTLDNYNKRHEQASTHRPYFFLDFDEKYKTIDLSKTRNYDSVFITGATGYLGAHLVFELLNQTNSKLSILLRGKDNSEAETRLSNILDFYFGNNFKNKYKTRIEIINGDMSREYLGLDTAKYTELVNTTDCIINAAAIVKHFGNVQEFIEVNVKGPEKLLYLTQTGKKKDFYHISTMSVASGEIMGDNPVLFTEIQSDVGHIFDSEYIRTKKESEKIVIDWRKEGVNTTVFRTGMLLSHSITGQFQKNIGENAFYRFLRSLFRIQCIPDVVLKNQDFSFIDYVSRAIVLLATRKCLTNEVFHIFNPYRLSLVDLAQYLQQANVEITIMPFSDFLDSLIQKYKNNEFKEDIINIVYYLYIYVSIKSTDFILRSKKTENLLQRIGFLWSKVTEDHIRKMVDYARSIDYFQ